MRSTFLIAGVVAVGVLAGCGAPDGPPPDTTSSGAPVHLDALFIGAHPDDESGTLATLGQWTATGARVGVLTVTRGEGGGNAVGPEEGPALGLLREGEERAAVGLAGVTDVFNLDEVDFFYTVSAPLTQQVWDERATVERVVRIVRKARPNVLLTMDPAPTPGNHGNHQQAARLAVEAYYAAADPAAFPEQITREGLRPFAPAKILRSGATGAGPTGPGCAAAFAPSDPTQDVFGVWSGASAPGGRRWAGVARDAERRYASQGWAGRPDRPSDPAQLDCEWFTQIASRVPYPAPGTPEAVAPIAILAGTAADSARLEIQAPFDVTAGKSFPATVRAGGPTASGTVKLAAPAGWSVGGSGVADADGRSAFTVTPPTDAAPGTKVRLAATSPSGYTATQLRVAPAVGVAQQPLPQVAEFDAWADRLGVPQLRGAVAPVLTLPSGGSREVPMTITNRSDTPRSGTVGVALPAGFAADAAEKPFTGLAPGASATVPFTITNTDPALPTSNQGGTDGDYGYRLTVRTADGATSTEAPALELVPATVVPVVESAPVIDGVGTASEYPAPALNLSRRWEGAVCASAQDCSATAHLARSGDTLNVLVEVRDSARGAALAAADCKRHWRTDSVEIALDPSGGSENTATTMKLAVLPYTAEGPPCAERDADNHQGPADQTAPGVRYASTTTASGYTVEAAIRLASLPGPVDPDRMGVNLLVYDSDTPDQAGKTRIGWSTWQGVQGDPYRWGRVSLPGYPPGGQVNVPKPVIPSQALSSSASPSAIEQAVQLHMPLSGGPAPAPNDSGWLTAAHLTGNAATVTVTSTGTGTITVFLRDAGGTAAMLTVPVDGAGTSTVTIPVNRPLSTEPHAIAAWTGASGTLASRVPIG